MAQALLHRLGSSIELRNVVAAYQDELPQQMHLCLDTNHSIFDGMINPIEDGIPKINIAKMTHSKIIVMVLTHSSHNSNQSSISYHPFREMLHGDGDKSA